MPVPPVMWIACTLESATPPAQKAAGAVNPGTGPTAANTVPPVSCQTSIESNPAPSSVTVSVPDANEHAGAADAEPAVAMPTHWKPMRIETSHPMRDGLPFDATARACMSASL